MSWRYTPRMVGAFDLRTRQAFGSLLYYTRQGLILAGTPLEDISVASDGTLLAATIFTKNVPCVTLWTERKGNKVTFKEEFHLGPFPPLLDAFLSRRKNQPA